MLPAERKKRASVELCQDIELVGVKISKIDLRLGRNQRVPLSLKELFTILFLPGFSASSRRHFFGFKRKVLEGLMKTFRGTEVVEVITVNL
jgi:hypothetical protein